MDDFLYLPDRNGTFVSKGDSILNNERPPIRTTASLPAGSVILKKNTRKKSVRKPNQKIAEAREKKEKQAFAKTNAKRAGDTSSAAPKKKKA
nr:hypothetical protein [Tanacetum cinerariifolium]